MVHFFSEMQIIPISRIFPCIQILLYISVLALHQFESIKCRVKVSNLLAVAVSLLLSSLFDDGCVSFFVYLFCCYCFYHCRYITYNTTKSESHRVFLIHRSDSASTTSRSYKVFKVIIEWHQKYNDLHQ